MLAIAGSWFPNPEKWGPGNQVKCYKACQDHRPAIKKRDNLVLWDDIVYVEAQEENWIGRNISEESRHTPMWYPDGVAQCGVDLRPFDWALETAAI